MVTVVDQAATDPVVAAKKADPTYASVPWNLYALRKRFNAEKPVIAPWWRGEESPSRSQTVGSPHPRSVTDVGAA